MFASFLSVSAQKKIIFVQAKMGKSIPVGTFAQTGVGVENGYAQTGNNLSFEGGYYIINKAGIYLSYSTAKFPFNDTQLGFDYGIQATVGDYQTEFYGIGLFYEFDPKNNFNIMARICFGEHRATFPQQHYEDGENVLDVPSNTQKKISIPIGIDFKYFIFQNLGFLASVDYQFAEHKHTWGVSGYYPVTAEWDISYQTFNFDLGVIFRL